MDPSQQDAEQQAMVALGLQQDGNFSSNDYEMLVQLDSGNKKHTLPTPLIDLLPDFPAAGECVICLSDEVAVGTLLPCGHTFHKMCIQNMKLEYHVLFL